MCAFTLNACAFLFFSRVGVRQRFSIRLVSSIPSRKINRRRRFNRFPQIEGEIDSASRGSRQSRRLILFPSRGNSYFETRFTPFLSLSLVQFIDYYCIRHKLKRTCQYGVPPPRKRSTQKLGVAVVQETCITRTVTVSLDQLTHIIVSMKYHRLFSFSLATGVQLKATAANI